MSRRGCIAVRGAIALIVLLAGCSEPMADDGLTLNPGPGDLVVTSVDGAPTWDRVMLDVDGACFVEARLQEWPSRFTVDRQVHGQAVPVTVGDQLLVDTSHMPGDATCQITAYFDDDAIGSWPFRR